MAQIAATYLSHMGSDAEIAADARVSFDRDQLPDASTRDDRLIRYLATNGHWSPFSHQMVKFRIEAPLFCARQLWKSYIGFYGGDAGVSAWNEVSRRYVDADPVFYVPDVVRARPEKSVKQGSGGAHPDSAGMRLAIKGNHIDALTLYRDMIGAGIAPEVARGELPQSVMTAWRWTGSLNAWARLCHLRLDPHSQFESQEVARQVSAAIAPLFPVGWTALMEAPQ